MRAVVRVVVTAVALWVATWLLPGVRAGGGGRLAEALDCAADMLRLAPDHAALWRETGVMHARLGHPGAAIRCLERFVALVPGGDGADRARQLIEEMRQRLN